MQFLYLHASQNSNAVVHSCQKTVKAALVGFDRNGVHSNTVTDNS